MLSGGPGGAWRPARPAWSYSESVLLDFLTAKAPLLGDFDPAPVDVNVHPRCRSSLRTKSPLRSKMNASRPIFLRSSGARFNRVPLRGPRSDRVSLFEAQGDFRRNVGHARRLFAR